MTGGSTDFPSMPGGYPVLGHIPTMYRGFPEFCRNVAEKYGPMVWIHGGPGAKQLMCTDRSALKLLQRKELSNAFYAEGFGALLGGTLLAFDGEEHKHIRHVLSPAFTPRHLRRSDVLPIMVEVIEAAVERWIEAGSVEILTGTQAIALEVIFRIIGVSPDDLPHWQKSYQRYLLAGLPSRGRIRGPLYFIARRARDWLDLQLDGIVDRERASGQGETLIGAISNARDDDGRLLDKALVVPNLRLLVLAGHETTASTMAWTALHLGQDEDLARRASDEVADVDSAEAMIGFATDADHLSLSEACFREAMRLYPPIHSTIRRTTEDLPWEDLGTIPAGALVNIPFVHLLRDPEAFARPDSFDADRWETRPRPGTLGTAMFGAGPHFCLGYHLAIPEGTLFCGLLLRALRRRGVSMERTESGPLPSPIFFPLAHPPRKLRLRFVVA